MAIQLISNLKVITSGKIPTVDTLGVGQAAFGKITADGKYHFYGNSDGVVKDIVVDSMTDIANANLQKVLEKGNETTLSIQFNADPAGNITIISADGLTTTIGDRALKVGATGFTDAGQPVLSANPNNTINSTQAQQMRTFLDVFSKDEVTAKITGVYKFKGSIKSFADLTAKPDYTPEVGDVWDIQTAGGTDKNGTAIKAGDNVAFTGPNKATDWDVLSGTIDLSGYYTKSDIDTTVSTLNASIKTADDKAAAAQTTATQALDKATTLENAGYQTAEDVQQTLTAGHYVSDENYVHTDNNFDAAAKAKVAKIVTDGDGTKVLTDNGTYQTLELNVVSI